MSKYLCHTIAESAAGKGVRLGAPGTNSRLVIDDLNRAIAALPFERSSQACDVGRGLRLAFLEALVRIHPGAITTNNKALFLACSHFAFEVSG